MFLWSRQWGFSSAGIGVFCGHGIGVFVGRGIGACRAECAGASGFFREKTWSCAKKREKKVHSPWPNARRDSGGSEAEDGPVQRHAGCCRLTPSLSQPAPSPAVQGHGHGAIQLSLASIAVVPASHSVICSAISVCFSRAADSARTVVGGRRAGPTWSEPPPAPFVALARFLAPLRSTRPDRPPPNILPYCACFFAVIP